MKRLLVALLFLLSVGSARAQINDIDLSCTTAQGSCTSVMRNTTGTSIAYFRLTWTKVGTVTGGTVQVDNFDGSAWTGTIISAQNVATNGRSLSAATVTAGARITITGVTGGGRVVSKLEFYEDDPTSASGGAASDVDVLSIAAGDNNIGNVDVVTLPALATGTNTIGGVIVKDAAGNDRGANVNASNELHVSAFGTAANDSTGNLYIPTLPAIASASTTTYTEGRQVALRTDIAGNLRIGGNVGCALADMDQQTVAISNSTAETTFITAVASERHHIVALDITSATATAVTVTIKDSTAGTTQAIYNLAASGGFIKGNGGAIILKQKAAVNNNWTATLSALSVNVNIVATFCKIAG